MAKIARHSFILIFLSVLMGFSYRSIDDYQKKNSATLDTLPDVCRIDNNTFKDGERIVYKLYYNWNFIWLSAGEVVFNVKDLGDSYYLTAKGKTYDSYDWFFEVRDKYECYVDKETLLPIISVRDVNEGNYTLYEKVDFNQDAHTAKSKRGDSVNKIKSEKVYDIDACVHDMLSAIYYTRNIDFNNYEAGQDFPLKIFLDREVWPIKVRFLGKEKKKIKDNGWFNTIKFRPEVIIGDVFKDGTEMTVWATDDKNRIPLMIESPITIGTVKVVLKEYNGLKYDFSAEL